MRTCACVGVRSGCLLGRALNPMRDALELKLKGLLADLNPYLARPIMAGPNTHMLGMLEPQGAMGPRCKQGMHGCTWQGQTPTCWSHRKQRKALLAPCRLAIRMRKMGVRRRKGKATRRSACLTSQSCFHCTYASSRLCETPDPPPSCLLPCAGSCSSPCPCCCLPCFCACRPCLMCCCCGSGQDVGEEPAALFPGL